MTRRVPYISSCPPIASLMWIFSLAHHLQPVVDKRCRSSVHELHVARPSSCHDRLAKPHRLSHAKSESFCPVQGDIDVATALQCANMRAINQIVADQDARIGPGLIQESLEGLHMPMPIDGLKKKSY
ncbi:hypothetical protein G6F35_017885 [Rhizopus arrhizus]|nr:hypothetical protein G6F35_017885 [Rhizopus arrhizus]